MRGNKGFEMNQRIKQLLKESTESRWYCGQEHDEVDQEKFAELIVKDCIRTLHSNGYDDAAKCLQDIHFGIENPV